MAEGVKRAWEEHVRGRRSRGRQRIRWQDKAKEDMERDLVEDAMDARRIGQPNP